MRPYLLTTTTPVEHEYISEWHPTLVDALASLAAQQMRAAHLQSLHYVATPPVPRQGKVGVASGHLRGRYSEQGA
jgi:hypothetical protein